MGVNYQPQLVERRIPSINQPSPLHFPQASGGEVLEVSTVWQKEITFVTKNPGVPEMLVCYIS